MPVLNKDSNTEDRNGLTQWKINRCLNDVERWSNGLMGSYIRIQNLPWTACTSDIKHFFRGLSIKQGGVLVRSSEAYVAFENLSDIHSAMYRRNILLHGCKLELSIVNEFELRKVLFRTVRRKLDFDSTSKRNVAKLYFKDTPRRKIRPTPVVKGNKQQFVSCSTFLPEEINPLSHKSSESDCGFTEMLHCGKRSISKMRRLHPTSVTSTMQTDNLAVFHPEEYNQAKKIRLGQ